MNEKGHVKFEEMKYCLADLFKKPPIFDTPPLYFKEIEQDPYSTTPPSMWPEFYEVILGESKFSS